MCMEDGILMSRKIPSTPSGVYCCRCLTRLLLLPSLSSAHPQTNFQSFNMRTLSVTTLCLAAASLTSAYDVSPSTPLLILCPHDACTRFVLSACHGAVGRYLTLPSSLCVHGMAVPRSLPWVSAGTTATRPTRP